MARTADVLRALFVASRPLSWINTAYPFAVVYVLTTGRVDIGLVVGTLFFLVPYNLLMYGVNDVFDYASDLANPRKGGAEGAALAPELHRLTIVVASALAGLFVAVLVVIGSERPWSWLVLAVSVFAVLAYSVRGLRFKEIPVVDSITSSVHFVSPAVYAIAVSGTVVTEPLLIALIAFFLWGIASHAFGAVQDIAPDREAGIGSIATALGARRTVRLAVGLWSIAGALMLFLPWPMLLVALCALPYVFSAWPYVNVLDEESGGAHRAWSRFLALNYVVGSAITILIVLGVREGMFL